MITKIRNTNDGFTIMEVIVSINIAFILLTFTISFYLFTAKLVGTTSKRIADNYDINNMICRIEEKLRKAESFFTIIDESELRIITSEEDSISISTSGVDLANIFLLAHYAEMKITILTKDKGELVIDIEEDKFSGNSQIVEFHSYEIENIQFVFTYKSKMHELVYWVDNTPTQSFINIR